MGRCTTGNHSTVLHPLSVWDFIASYNIPMATKGSCLNLITAGSIIQTVTLITPSKAMFLVFLDYTLAGLHWIKSSCFRSAWPSEKWCGPFLWGARRLSNGYYFLKHKNMGWWCQQDTKIRIVGLIVSTLSSGLSNTLIWCILYLSEQLLAWHIWWEGMLHQIESTAYGL